VIQLGKTLTYRMQSNVLKWCLQHYRLCTKSYLADGKDGYDVFKSCEQLVRKYCVEVVTDQFDHLILIFFVNLSLHCDWYSCWLSSMVTVWKTVITHCLHCYVCLDFDISRCLFVQHLNLTYPMLSMIEVANICRLMVKIAQFYRH